MKPHALRRASKALAVFLLFAVSLNALAAGYSFITDPSGEGLGISTDYLNDRAPFENYLVPGIVLFGVLGIFCLLAGLIAVLGKRQYPVMLLVAGMVIVGWICIQLFMVTAFHPLHAIVGSSGLVIFICGWYLQREEDGGRR